MSVWVGKLWKPPCLMVTAPSVLSSYMSMYTTTSVTHPSILLLLSIHPSSRTRITFTPKPPPKTINSGLTGMIVCRSCCWSHFLQRARKRSAGAKILCNVIKNQLKTVQQFITPRFCCTHTHARAHARQQFRKWWPHLSHRFCEVLQCGDHLFITFPEGKILKTKNNKKTNSLNRQFYTIIRFLKWGETNFSKEARMNLKKKES